MQNIDSKQKSKGQGQLALTAQADLDRYLVKMHFIDNGSFICRPVRITCNRNLFIVITRLSDFFFKSIFRDSQYFD